MVFFSIDIATVAQLSVLSNPTIYTNILDLMVINRINFTPHEQYGMAGKDVLPDTSLPYETPDWSTTKANIITMCEAYDAFASANE